MMARHRSGSRYRAPVGTGTYAAAVLPRRHVFGLDLVDLPSLEPLIDELATWQPAPVVDGEPLPCVVTPNVDLVVRYDQGADAATSHLFATSRYVLPDGQPVVWASRLVGEPLRARLAGSDLVAGLWPRLVASGTPTLVVAPSAEIARRVESDAVSARAIVAPALDPADPASMATFVDDCWAAIREHRPSHVFVTLGFPKPYQVIDGLISRAADAGAAAPLMLAVGAGFDMHYGLVPRAPAWMQRWGLEWLHRFSREPRRLFRRYFVEDPVFVRIVWREWRARRRGDDRS